MGRQQVWFISAEGWTCVQVSTWVSCISTGLFGVFGLVCNCFILYTFYCKWKTHNFTCMHVHLTALLIENILYNLIGCTVNIQLDFRTGILGEEIDQEVQRYFSLVCCLFNAATVVYLFLISLDCSLALYRGEHRKTEISKAKLRILGVPLFMTMIALLTLFWPATILALFPIPPTAILIYVIILLKTRRALGAMGDVTDMARVATMKTCHAMAITGTMSLAAIAPCFYAYAVYTHTTIYQLRLFKLESCLAQVAFSILHHPLSGLNYCMQPLLIYWTFPSAREDFLLALYLMRYSREKDEDDDL